MTKPPTLDEDASICRHVPPTAGSGLGLGSCWIQVRGRYTENDLESETYVQNILEMPDTILPVCIIAIGHKAEERKPQDIAKLMWEKVHIGTWREC